MQLGRRITNVTLAASDRVISKEEMSPEALKTDDGMAARVYAEPLEKFTWVF